METLGHFISSHNFRPIGHSHRPDWKLSPLQALFLIFVANLLAPSALPHVFRRGRDLPFNRMFMCFGVAGVVSELAVYNGVGLLEYAILPRRLVPQLPELVKTNVNNEAVRSLKTKEVIFRTGAKAVRHLKTKDLFSVMP